MEEEAVELTGADKLLEKITPHAGTIGLAVVAGFIGFAAIAFLISRNFDTKAQAWRDQYIASTVAYQISDISGLKEVADTYPDKQAGMWAAQMAADFQLRMGLQQLDKDREGGLDMIRKATAGFQTVLDAPQTAKSTMLQRRSQFGMAYASESLGDFEKAKTLYAELVDAAPDSAFAEPARRGMKRSSSPEYAAVYKTFEEWKVVLGDAPGDILPGRPNIDFPNIDDSADLLNLNEPVITETELNAPGDSDSGDPRPDSDKSEAAKSTPDPEVKEEKEVDSSEPTTPPSTKKDDLPPAPPKGDNDIESDKN